MKLCTNCEGGVYDYEINKLYCHGEIKEDNKPCSEWTEPSNKGSISYSAWNSIKRRY